MCWTGSTNDSWGINPLYFPSLLSAKKAFVSFSKDIGWLKICLSFWGGNHQHVTLHFCRKTVKQAIRLLPLLLWHMVPDKCWRTGQTTVQSFHPGIGYNKSCLKNTQFSDPETHVKPYCYCWGDGKVICIHHLFCNCSLPFFVFILSFIFILKWVLTSHGKAIASDNKLHTIRVTPCWFYVLR